MTRNRPEKQRQLWEMFAGASYNLERDGTLEEYLDAQLRGECFRQFYGLQQLELLRDEGWLKLGISYVRFMYNIGRGDAHYLITDDWRLEGMNGGFHSGESGIFDMQEIFSENPPPFEVGNLYGPAWESRMQQTEARLCLNQTIDEQRKELDDLTSS